jgi:hypothetical protein
MLRKVSGVRFRVSGIGHRAKRMMHSEKTWPTDCVLRYALCTMLGRSDFRIPTSHFIKEL